MQWFWLSEKNERTLDFSFPDDNQAFGLRTKLRLLRINQLYEAEKISQNGKMAFVDGYYDKLMYFYLGKTGTNWLMHKNNAYFKATKAIAKTDYQILPNADVIIGLRVSFDTWIHFLNSRGRPLDLNPDFQRECFMTQELFLNTAQRYCRDFNKTYIEIEQQIDGLDEIVQKIKEKIENLFIDTHQNPD